MLGEGFLRLLCYREERKFAAASKRARGQTDPGGAHPSTGSVAESEPAGLRVQDAKTGLNQEELDSTPVQGLRVAPLGPAGLAIPDSVSHPVCIEDCSLLDQYPDLQVAESGRLSNNPSRAAVTQREFNLPHPDWVGQQDPLGDPVSSMPDQGYLAMGHSGTISLDLPGSGLEPMSNSVLNGLLEKQLEEVYMLHLTDNLARCNSQLGNSLLHGLLAPPQPGGQTQGPLDSLEASMEDGSAEKSREISYLNTHKSVSCSSNFSSPVLRISANPHHQ